MAAAVIVNSQACFELFRKIENLHLPVIGKRKLILPISPWNCLSEKIKYFSAIQKRDNFINISKHKT